MAMVKTQRIYKSKRVMLTARKKRQTGDDLGKSLAKIRRVVDKTRKQNQRGDEAQMSLRSHEERETESYTPDETFLG